MALEFPTSPTNGQQYVAPTGVTYIWDGEKWSTLGSYTTTDEWKRVGTTISPTVDGDTIATTGVTLTGGTTGSPLVRDSSGKVGIGTATPGSVFHVKTGTNANILFDNLGGGGGTARISALNDAVNANTDIQIQGTDILFAPGSGYAAKFDSAGRLLVGTTAAPGSSIAASALIQAQGRVGFPSDYCVINARAGYTPSSNDAALGFLTFCDSNNNTGAWITAYSDGGGWTAGTSHPTRLAFSTTPSGSTTPVERMRILSSGFTEFTNDIRPSVDNALQVGQSGLRWSVIFAGTGTINTSDANLKQDAESLDAAELQVAKAIKGLVKKFRFIDAVADKGDDARVHVGVIAQEVEQAFMAEGLDPRRYGMFCENTLEDGSKRLGIRYDELLAFVVAAQVAALEDLEAKVAALENPTP